MGPNEEEIRFVVDTNILIPALMKDNSLTGRKPQFCKYT
jgi:predicted nucleic acid-binding protein